MQLDLPGDEEKCLISLIPSFMVSRNGAKISSIIASVENALFEDPTAAPLDLSLDGPGCRVMCFGVGRAGGAAAT